MERKGKEVIYDLMKEYSSDFDKSKKDTAVILAAGHGKRIKSHTSKMLHKIWESPTVERVFNACKNGFKNSNSILVVGIKAVNVIKVIGKRENTLFAYQEEQNGTGHALQVGIEQISSDDYDGTVYVFPGDMGLIDAETVAKFKEDFESSSSDMMVLTGIYEGEPENNYYGRIIRVKDKDAEGNPSEDAGKVIEIIEHKDILAIPDGENYFTEYNGRKYSFTKRELIENNEYNSGVFAFKFQPLKKMIYEIKSDNAQGEIYVTDLISIFNQHGLNVGAVSPEKQYVLMGFNNKSVLKKMEEIARDLVYNKLKDLVMIEDADDFYIADEVVEQIIEMDRKGIPLDIFIGKGVYIGKNVKLNYNVEIRHGAYLNGNIELGENVIVWDRVHLSTYPNQTMRLGKNVQIFWDDIVKGNIRIDENSRIESSVIITGSDEFPVRIGKNVIVKGSSYLFGCIVEDDVHIEHCILIKKKLYRKTDSIGNVIPVKFYFPEPEGIEIVENL